MSGSESTQGLIGAVESINVALAASTGLPELSRSVVTYWTMATHALPNLGTFPLLGLSGKMGSGKSQTLKLIQTFAYKPMAVSLRGMTLPSIRDAFTRGFQGTIIAEEADSAWNDSNSAFEQLLSDRHQRGSATAALKQSDGRNGWKGMEQQFFGATALHRRIPFNDAALDGRTIFVRFKANHDRRYVEYDLNDLRLISVAEQFRDVTFALPDVEQPTGVAARVFNTYKPLLAVASLCGDSKFLLSILRQLQEQTLELKEAQASEPDSLVLQAIVEVIFGDGCDDWSNIKFSTLHELIYRNHKVNLSPRQIGPIARELGFATKQSHGVTVIAPTPGSLLRASSECGYTDEDIERLRSELIEQPPKA